MRSAANLNPSPQEKFLENLSRSIEKLKRDQKFYVELDMDGCFVHGRIPHYDPDNIVNKDLVECLEYIKKLVNNKGAKFEVNICSTADLRNNKEIKAFVLNELFSLTDAKDGIVQIEANPNVKSGASEVLFLRDGKVHSSEIISNYSEPLSEGDSSRGYSIDKAKVLNYLIKTRAEYEKINPEKEVTLGDVASRTLFVDNDFRYHENNLNPTEHQELREVIGLCPISTAIEDVGGAFKKIEKPHKNEVSRNINQYYAYDPENHIDLSKLKEELKSIVRSDELKKLSDVKIEFIEKEGESISEKPRYYYESKLADDSKKISKLEGGQNKIIDQDTFSFSAARKINDLQPYKDAFVKAMNGSIDKITINDKELKIKFAVTVALMAVKNGGIGANENLKEISRQDLRKVFGDNSLEQNLSEAIKFSGSFQVQMKKQDFFTGRKDAVGEKRNLGTRMKRAATLENLVSFCKKNGVDKSIIDETAKKLGLSLVPSTDVKLVNASELNGAEPSPRRV